MKEPPVRRSTVLVVLAYFAITACASTPRESSAPATPTATTATAQEVVVSLHDIPCESCLRGSKKALLALNGVQAADVERDAVAVRIRYDPSVIDEDTLVATVTDLGYAAELGEGVGSYLPPTAFAESADVQLISTGGEDVDIAAHSVAGKVTVIDFFAIWCGPCRVVEKKLVELQAERDDLAVRRVNVPDEESPVAKRYLVDDEAMLPFVVVFDASGKEVERIAGLDVDRMVAAIAKATAAGS
jgi:thioredoxin 1